MLLLLLIRETVTHLNDYGKCLGGSKNLTILPQWRKHRGSWVGTEMPEAEQKAQRQTTHTRHTHTDTHTPPHIRFLRNRSPARNISEGHIVYHNRY